MVFAVAFQNTTPKGDGNIWLGRHTLSVRQQFQNTNPERGRQFLEV